MLDVKELKGKPVTTITGRSALYAWGKVLIHFGLIDEIMFEKSIEAISAARVEGIAEAKEKMNLVKQQRQLARARHIQRQKEKSKGDKSHSPLVVRVKGGETVGDLPEGMVSSDEEGNSSDNAEAGGEREDATEEELELREKTEQLLESYEKRLAESRNVAIDLADARIRAISPFLCNPFFDSEYSSTQQKTWLTTVVRKEKSKMGSTGNRRKVVTATDLLEKSASLFNSDIEHLLEGLPGSEFCHNYVFHEMRGSGAVGVNQSWMHEAKVRQEREQIKRKKRNKENEAKASQEREKERKRKAREDEKEERKKQRMEELDQKKKARAEERLSRLSTQIDERLFKEACFQRDRVVQLASKLLNKEVFRRRKAAEGLAAYTVESECVVSSSNQIEQFCSSNELPPNSEDFMAEVIRIWDFISSYRNALDAIEKIPSLGVLQNAINALSDIKTSQSSRNEAITLLTNLAVALCQPISSGVIKSLSSSLSTSLQETDKQNNEISDSTEGEKTESDNDLDPNKFPVNAFTWKEIARLALLSDALNELGYSKIEQAHLLRGFRSGGHPNSKEAKRLRRGEDNALVLRRQALSEMAARSNGRGVKVSVETPSTPSVDSTNWIYFLHNVKALPTNAATGMKNNLRKAIKSLKRASFESVNGENPGLIISELQRNVSILEDIGTSYTSSTDTLNACKKVRQSALRLLEKVTGERFSTSVAKTVISRDIDPISIGKQRSIDKVILSFRKIYRKKVGLLQSLALSYEDYKKSNLRKEEYMVAALQLKEDLERKNAMEDDDDDDDDEDDEIDKGENKDQNSEQKVNEPISEAEEKQPIGKKTDYDGFCGDDPYAPEFIRRCLAVLRTVCALPAAEEFLYPVDPQVTSKYYDAIVTPMSLYDAGKALQVAGKRLRAANLEVEKEVEKEVAQFGRNIRLICQNCACFSNVGGMIISSAEEMIRVFERLFFDWVLSPSDVLPPLDKLDDEKCVEFHPSDEEEWVLLCDGCEGKFNMSRLDPPLLSVPQGDWYCPRCLEGRCWATLDPRIGRKVLKDVSSSENRHATRVAGLIKACKFSSMPGAASPKNTFCYVIKYENDTEEIWSLEEVDKALLQICNPAPKIHCLEATSESLGYGSGVASELILEAVPVPLNPHVSAAAAQKAVSSTSFKESIIAGASLLVNETSEMSSSEWIRLLILLVMKCASSDPLQDAASQLENEAFQKAGTLTTKASKIKSIRDMVPEVTDDEDDQIGSINNSQSNNTMKIEQILSTSESEIDEKKKIMALVNLRKERQKARDDVMLASCIKSQIKPALASFNEDHVTQVIDNSLASNVEGITLSSCQSNGIVCDFCGLSDSALGSPLVRVPNIEEWTERMHIASKQMNSNLIAKFSKADGLIQNEEAPIHDGTEQAENEIKFVSVQVRVGEELFSIKEENPHIQDCINDSGMLDFLPRNSAGFRQELEARVDSGLPFISGTLSGHECCARALHKARVEKEIHRKKKDIARLAHRSSGNWCGRTLSLGCDKAGRTYWKFLSDPRSLFVLSCRSDGSKTFKRFSDPETIASVIVFLGNHSIVKEIREIFPEARKVLESGAWSSRLQMRGQEHKCKKGSEIKADQKSLISEDKEFDIYAVGEDILVESVCGKLLWNGSIIAVAQNSQKIISGYRIHYTGWSSRFDEWVHPERLLEPSDENLQAQVCPLLLIFQ